jgi:hypothetical protein
MRRILFLTILLSAVTPCIAQQQSPPQIKMLSPSECAVIEKRPIGDYMVNGTINIGNITISNSNVSRDGINYGGIDPFDVITRSCFNGKPS